MKEQSRKTLGHPEPLSLNIGFIKLDLKLNRLTLIVHRRDPDRRGSCRSCEVTVEGELARDPDRRGSCRRCEVTVEGELALCIVDLPILNTC